MILHYNLSVQDYIEFNQFQYDNVPSLKRQHRIQLVAIPVLFVVLAILYISFVRPESIIVPVLLCILGSIIYIMVYPMLIKREVKKQVIRLMNEGKKSELVGEYTLTIDDEGILEEKNNGNVWSSFDSIEKILMDEKHLYVYNSPMSAFMIPHSAFDSTEHEDETVAYIKKMACL